MPSSMFPFVRKIAVCCALFVVLALPIGAATATSALAAPLDAPIVNPQSGANSGPQSGGNPSSQSVTNPGAQSVPNTGAQAAADPGAELADFAQQYVGTPYRWGGASPSGFDCTGFVMWVYSQFGVSLPHNEAGQLASGESVSTDDLQPGDVLVFANTYRRGLSHTGIYVGNGQFVHAADERHGVTVSALWDGYWAPRLVGASRAIA